jgi:hypothetical protein
LFPRIGDRGCRVGACVVGRCGIRGPRLLGSQLSRFGSGAFSFGDFFQSVSESFFLPHELHGEGMF